MTGRRSLVTLCFVLVIIAFAFFGLRRGPEAQSENRGKADHLIREADLKLSASDFKGNIELLKSAADIDPTNPRVWWKLCEGYQFTDRLDLAVSACMRQLENTPDGISYNSLGLAYQAKKDYPHAVEAFEQAMKRSDTSPICGNLAWALLRAQQYVKAIPIFKHLTKLDADVPSELVSDLEALGATYTKLGQTENAREAFAKIQKLNPDQPPETCELKTNNKGELSVRCTSSR